MSLPWRDQVDIRLDPRGFTLARRARGLKRRVVEEPPGVVTDGSLGGDWSPALSAVRDALHRLEWRRADACVVVADHWARYAVVPWRRELTTDEERLAHGRLILRQAYGDEMAGWTVQLGRTVHGCPQLACALPAKLVLEVSQVLQQAALRLVSLRPHLVVAFNRWRRCVPDGGGWFVTVEDGGLAAVRLVAGNWTEVHRIRVDGDWTDDLNRLRTFDRLARGDRSAGPRVLVDAPPSLRGARATAASDLEWLDAEAVPRNRFAQLRRRWRATP